MVKSVNEQLEIIKRGAVEIISEQELRLKLNNSLKDKKPLIIKAGFDPTAPDMHLGHCVLLRKLRKFQELGHKVVFLIGDFTAMIGDPTGRSEKRKQLGSKEVAENAKTYKNQIGKILDMNKVEITFNSSWFRKMSVADMLNLTTHATVSQMLARADFKKRLSRNEDISLLEFMYPLLQGYDSVKLAADIEIGGTDQIFNLLVGRDMQKDYGMPQQVVMTMPILEGLDGVQKMSKSFANFIGINEGPSEMFGKIMSLSDEMMSKYYELLTDFDIAQAKNMHPKEAKENLAQLIVSQFHGEKAAKSACIEFNKVFSNKETPADMPEYKISQTKNVLAVLVECGLVASGNEARRLIKQGAIFFNGKKVESDNFVISGEGILKIGSRRFLRIIL
ncbi:MAG: tyrosine--tRNA ligase [Candidatus Omnitrophota bacterium]|jgi:tyrosyl-tRNA synthetase|nr:MAG: tyrosine--tRNA ligase [Candidatus Omnitrophota bacterium]